MKILVGRLDCPRLRNREKTYANTAEVKISPSSCAIRDSVCHEQRRKYRLNNKRALASLKLVLPFIGQNGIKIGDLPFRLYTKRTSHRGNVKRVCGFAPGRLAAQSEPWHEENPTLAPEPLVHHNSLVNEMLNRTHYPVSCWIPSSNTRSTKFYISVLLR